MKFLKNIKDKKDYFGTFGFWVMLFWLMLEFLFFLFSYRIMSIGFGPVYAADLYVNFKVDAPSTARIGDTFDVLISLDSSKETSLQIARLALRFDSNKLELMQVTANTELFCRYPEDPPDYVSNTEKGIIIVTGYSDGTATCPFVNVRGGKPFVKLVFKAKSAGTADFAFLYDGGYENNDVSAVLDNGSPPRFVLAQPQDFVVSLTPIQSFVTPSRSSTPTPPKSPSSKRSAKVPETGITDNWVIAFVLGGGLVAFGSYLLYTRRAPPDLVIYE